MEKETKKAILISVSSLIGIYAIYKLFFSKKNKEIEGSNVKKEIPKIDLTDLKFVSDETPKGATIGGQKFKQEQYKDSKGVYYSKMTILDTSCKNNSCISYIDSDGFKWDGNGVFIIE